MRATGKTASETLTRYGKAPSIPTGQAILKRAHSLASKGALRMSEPISVGDIGLSPIAGKAYFSIDREWREEFIYFLMVDRFQDDVVRPIVAGSDRSQGIATPNTFYGGNIKGVTKNLDYIAGL